MKTETTDPQQNGSLIYLLALAAGLAVANIYYNQPVLGLIAGELKGGDHVGLVATITQMGYTLGLLFLVPLCDTLNRKRLVLILCALLVVSAALAALAPGMAVLMAASAGMGVAATITQMVVPMAADLAREGERGKAVGIAFSGVLCGILLARVVSGAVGQWLGWREAFWLACAFAVLLSALLAWRLPDLPSKSSLPYGRLLVSMLQLLRDYRALRYASIIQACVFGAFSAFWSVLALYLQGPAYGLGASVAGSFGIVGLVGVLAAQAGGRLTDRFGVRCGVLIGALTSIAAFGIMSFSGMTALVLGVIVLDFGVSIAQVSNQSLILGLSESARGRVNTIYMTVFFLGGSLGSAAASQAWAAYRWPGVMLIGGAFALAGLFFHLLERRCTCPKTRVSDRPSAQECC